jgi:hypothetical protein
MRQLMIQKLDTTRSGKYSDFIVRINSELLELLFLQHIPTEKPNKKLYEQQLFVNKVQCERHRG